ncbi:DUF1810 domain-containing protein [Shimia aestuarii]|uniref:Uncharacterized protein, DUF1810 family n=1 Tax=Shimia aestuarii TaxID=254406 RepID=A0A1I4JVR8_9RHOB|nr:DUF1810 domain-containing protein [Shimia aestuarii]SFL70451.1 Uncharacterized protein, DUF1810 family [Shimia aestuarii]
MIDIAALERFLPRQDETHARAVAELRAGRKVTHWIWWEIPQLRSLGRSQRARDYGLADLDEAERYLAHPVLAARLIALCDAVLLHEGMAPEAIMGPVDALKLQSSMTLFSAVPGAPDVFERVLVKFFEGQRCALTEAELASADQRR